MKRTLRIIMSIVPILCQQCVLLFAYLIERNFYNVENNNNNNIVRPFMTNMETNMKQTLAIFKKQFFLQRN